MEGNQVGKTDAAAPTRAADFDVNDLLWPSSNFATETSPLADPGQPKINLNDGLIDLTRPESNPDDDLVWPEDLSAKSANGREKPQPKLGTVLATCIFIIATLFAFALGPAQLILLASTQDYDFVTATYYPTVLRITLLSSGLFMAANIAALFLSLRSTKRQAIISTILCTGSIALFAVAWVAAFIVELQPNQLAIIILPLILIFWFAALMASKSFYTETKLSRTLEVLILLLMLCSGTEIIFDGIYVFAKTTVEAPAIDLTELIDSEAAARLDGVPEQLAKFTFALCQGSYDIVVYDTENPNAGLFECKNSHEVYSVSDPEISQDTDRFANATYLGQTYNEAIESYFPSTRYIYRNLTDSELELPNELVLLLPSESEEALVDQNLAAIAALTATEPNLNVNIFYTDLLDPEFSTRDYILTTAVGTLALTDWLPRGRVLTGADTPNEALRYHYSLDRALTALSTLGMNPGAYSSQTRDALTNRRHLHFNSRDLDPSDEGVLREQLLAGFVDPA